MGCVVNVKEMFLKKKYGPAAILRNVNSVICFIFKLQLKFRNENYSSIIINFRTGLR